MDERGEYSSSVLFLKVSEESNRFFKRSALIEKLHVPHEFLPFLYFKHLPGWQGEEAQRPTGKLKEGLLNVKPTTSVWYITKPGHPRFYGATAIGNHEFRRVVRHQITNGCFFALLTEFHTDDCLAAGLSQSVNPKVADSDFVNGTDWNGEFLLHSSRNFLVMVLPGSESVSIFPGVLRIRNDGIPQDGSNLCFACLLHLMDVQYSKYPLYTVLIPPTTLHAMWVNDFHAGFAYGTPYAFHAHDLRSFKSPNLPVAMTSTLKLASLAAVAA